MRTADFDFVLPPELIAQHPAPRRDASRLLVFHRNRKRVEHRKFPEIREFFQPGDALVLNNSRVILARLRATRPRSGGRSEILLLEENTRNDWWAMLRPAKRSRIGMPLILCDAIGEATDIHAVVVETNQDGHRRLQFSGTPDIKNELAHLGEIPLPPYITRATENDDRDRYQTVFAESDGSVAAPTAGLHFTPRLLEQIRADGVKICFVTLHVGPGTFLPVKTDSLEAHQMHEERFELNEETVRAVNEAKAGRHHVIAVGTTTVRALESVAAQNDGKLVKNAGKTGIFIHPPFRFQIVDALLTNFHLPCSTLLMLASAFAAPNRIHGREIILSAYAEAIRERYRFYSYGDAMLIL